MFKNTKASVRNIFFAGLLVTLPLAVSIFLFQFFFVRIDAILSPFMTKVLIKAGMPVGPDFRLPGLGLAATILIIFFAGLLTRNIVGRKIMEIGEAILVKIPIFKNIYVGAKQVIETFGTSSKAFSKVVLIEYPRKGIYALAFITSNTKKEINEKIGKEMINIFLPTTPNPTSGFFLLVSKEELIELDMSVEDGIKMLISAGLVSPSNSKTESELTEITEKA